jgi:hypothetical protein
MSWLLNLNEDEMTVDSIETQTGSAPWKALKILDQDKEEQKLPKRLRRVPCYPFGVVTAACHNFVTKSNAIVCVLTDSKGHLTRKGYFKLKHKPDRAREAQWGWEECAAASCLLRWWHVTILL